MNKIEIISTYVTSVLLLMTTIVGFVIKLINVVNSNKGLKNAITIRELLKDTMIEAEKIADMSGDEKKQFVLDEVKKLTDNKRIPFDAKEIEETLEKIIAFTKSINNNAKDQ